MESDEHDDLLDAVSWMRNRDNSLGLRVVQDLMLVEKHLLKKTLRMREKFFGRMNKFRYSRVKRMNMVSEEGYLIGDLRNGR